MRGTIPILGKILLYEHRYCIDYCILIFYLTCEVPMYLLQTSSKAPLLKTHAARLLGLSFVV